MQLVMELLREYDVFIPKFHILIHAICDTHFKGNPAYYSSWLDESLNKVLKRCCRWASQAAFDETTLFKMKKTLESDPFCLQARKRAMSSSAGCSENMLSK